jgi:hypothetical protein
VSSVALSADTILMEISNDCIKQAVKWMDVVAFQRLLNQSGAAFIGKVLTQVLCTDFKVCDGTAISTVPKHSSPKPPPPK